MFSLIYFICTFQLVNNIYLFIYLFIYSFIYLFQYRIAEGFLNKLKSLAERRRLEDLTICPIITWNNEKILKHIDLVLKIDGAKLLFGGKPL